MTSKAELIDALAVIAGEHWASQKKPIYVSNIPRALKERFPNLDLQEVLGDLRLKRMIKETESAGNYELIEHPSHPAKVMLAPRSANYKLAPENNPESQSASQVLHGRNKEAMLAFFRALSSLPEKELEKINIPVSVIVKLLQ
ncbi:hypothetical protein [Dyella choica]|uniref:Uncharacterized protein n=1 Tax=Dyella choica TaxID=1927959 RepID=A0A432M8P8_9GAMM|nr:hypothetical protein [Dyella choica]RUL78254.1 hypothetical protein EKH80_05315 [Dyella choica]